jgi:hypothetical protein
MFRQARASGVASDVVHYDGIMEGVEPYRSSGCMGGFVLHFGSSARAHWPGGGHVTEVAQ